jgi:DNA mismatch endonuclease (patch repair protein)
MRWHRVAATERPGSPPPEPHRVRPGAMLSSRMSTLARRDTAPEVALRRELHRRGLRYRVHAKVPGNNRRTIDIAFSRVKLAVYVDGCFWHGCAEHGTQPRTNNQWWKWKIDRNRTRDADTNRALTEVGWAVVRVWEHEDVKIAADRVEAIWRDRAKR